MSDAGKKQNIPFRKDTMEPLSFDQNAYWLWPRLCCCPQNMFAGFRHDFHLREMPSAAPFLITADQSYRLWVNGQYVCRGPVRGHQANWYYDTVDLLPFLKTGKNWISVEAYNPGISHYSYHYCGRAGFLCSARWDNGTVIASRLSEWLVFRNTAYNPYTGRLSSQMGFQEELDLRTDDRSWITEPENFTIPAQPEWFIPVEVPQGTLPWSCLSPRPTELLDENWIPTAAIIASGKGICDEKPSDQPFPENNFIRNFACRELNTVQYHSVLPDSVRKNKSLVFSFPPSSAGTFYVVLLDMGRLEWLPGTAEMEADTQDSNAIMDIAFLHYVPEKKIAFTAFPSKDCLVSPGARFHLRKGHNAFSTYQISGTRYAALILRGNGSPVRIVYRWRSAVASLDITGNFQCSDPVLNEIYALSVHTQRCCAMDSFVDTPWREQAQWWGDVRIQAKNVFFLSGDSRLLEQGIRSLAGQPGPEGLLYAMAPTTVSGPVLPDYCLTWIQTQYDYYCQTGKTDLFLENKERCRQISDYFERQRGKDGLIHYDNRFWLFEDWANLPKRNAPAFLNLLYLYTRIIHKKMLEAAGFSAEADAMRPGMEQDRMRIVHAFADPAQRLLVPEINEKGEQTGVPSVHDQVLALLCGLCHEYQESFLTKRVIPCLRGELQKDTAAPSSFWATFLLQAAEKFQLIPDALSYLRKGWEPMISTGTAWEHFVADDKSAAASVCHAWSGHPVYHLPELLFGLRQLEPCWESVELKPCFLTEQASLVLPVPGGYLKCNWENGLFHIKFPEGLRVKLDLPGESFNLEGPVSRTIKMF